METEQMMPLAATECVQEAGFVKPRLCMLNSDEQTVMTQADYIDQYVNELLSTSLSNAASAYKTNLDVDLTKESPEKKTKLQTQKAFAQLSAVDDNGKSL